MGSQPGGSTRSPLTAWIAVAVIVVGACLLAAGIVAGSAGVSIAGAALGVAGAVYAWAVGIMSHTEEYEMTRQDTG